MKTTYNTYHESFVYLIDCFATEPEVIAHFKNKHNLCPSAVKTLMKTRNLVFPAQNKAK